MSKSKLIQIEGTKNWRKT